MRRQPYDPALDATEQVDSPFVDRYDAGERLAEAVPDFLEQRMISPGEVVVAGVTEGGLPLAYLVSIELGAPVEPAPVEALSAPHQRSVRVGMLVDDGVAYVDERLGDRHGARGSTLDHLVDRARERLDRRMAQLGDEPGAHVRDCHVLLVDDAIDSGTTMVACADWLRRWGARSVFGAVAVASERGLRRADAHVDGLLTLRVVEDDVAPAACFLDPRGTSDSESAQLMSAIHLLNDEHAEVHTFGD